MSNHEGTKMSLSLLSKGPDLAEAFLEVKQQRLMRENEKVITDFLLENDHFTPVAKEVARRLMSHFPYAHLKVCVDVDPEDGHKRLAFELLVKENESQVRGDLWGYVIEEIEPDFEAVKDEMIFSVGAA